MTNKAYEAALAISKRHHRENKTFSGSLAFHHRKMLDDLIVANDIRTLLDYGCGKGEQYNGDDPISKDWPDTRVTLYDPAVPGLDVLPAGTFDMTICTHTLGCIPVTEWSRILDLMIQRTNKILYIGELIGPVKKRLFDQKTHPYDWIEKRWVEELRVRLPWQQRVRVYLGIVDPEEPNGVARHIIEN